MAVVDVGRGLTGEPRSSVKAGGAMRWSRAVSAAAAAACAACLLLAMVDVTEDGGFLYSNGMWGNEGGMLARATDGGAARVDGSVELASRDAHEKHKSGGGKYARELQQLRSHAGPDRKNAMAEINDLEKRATGEGGGRGGGGGGSSDGSSEMDKGGHGHIPRAVMEIGRHGSKSRHHDGLGRLAAAHGIESSKKMLAEIMSLRHYKRSNNEIQELSHGFEKHSSLSHRFESTVNKDTKGVSEDARHKSRSMEAAALRLEAGRKSRDEMEQKVETESEGTIARALEETFRPMQKLLHRDEIKLDKLDKRGERRMMEDSIADKDALKLKAEMLKKVDDEAQRLVKAKETEMRHKSREYLKKVHLKVKAALNSVVNPDTLNAPAAASAPVVEAGQGDGWDSQMSSFLADTKKYMSEQEETPKAPAIVHKKLQVARMPRATLIGGSQEPGGGKATEKTVIEATRGQLEEELRSEEAKRDREAPAGAAEGSRDALKKAAKARVGSKREGLTDKVAKVKKVTEKKNKAFERALEGYL